jgi:NADH:ubiquinone oxidoreductase subunit 3 (subunit A)
VLKFAAAFRVSYHNAYPLEKIRDNFPALRLYDRDVILHRICDKERKSISIQKLKGFFAMNILSDWAFIGVFFVLAPLLPALPVVIAGILSPRKPNAIKQATYECGVETVGDTWVQFKVQYYVYGLIFLVFDVEMVFLFPWALAYNQLFYAWGKNALEWS